MILIPHGFCNLLKIKDLWKLSPYRTFFGPPANIIKNPFESGEPLRGWNFISTTRNISSILCFISRQGQTAYWSSVGMIELEETSK